MANSRRDTRLPEITALAPHAGHHNAREPEAAQRSSATSAPVVAEPGGEEIVIEVRLLGQPRQRASGSPSEFRHPPDSASRLARRAGTRTLVSVGDIGTERPMSYKLLPCG